MTFERLMQTWGKLSQLLQSMQVWMLVLAVLSLLVPAFYASLAANKAARAQAVFMANDVRTRVVESARLYQEARNAMLANKAGEEVSQAAAAFELSHALHAMNTYFMDARRFGFEKSNEKFMVRALWAFVNSEHAKACRAGKELPPVSELSMLKDYQELKKLAADCRLDPCKRPSFRSDTRAGEKHRLCGPDVAVP